MAQSREQRIYEAGLARADFDPEIQLQLQPWLRCMAAMIAEATKPKPARKKDPEAKQDYLRGTHVVAIIKNWAPDAVAYEPAQARTVAAIGKAYRELKCDENDLVQLGQYLERGGLDWMSDKPTLSYLGRHFDDLVAKARKSRPAESALDKVRR